MGGERCSASTQPRQHRLAGVIPRGGRTSLRRVPARVAFSMISSNLGTVVRRLGKAVTCNPKDVTGSPGRPSEHAKYQPSLATS